MHEQKLKVIDGSQNFDNNTLKVMDSSGVIHTCQMWQDDHGDIGFTFNGQLYWLRYMD